MTPPRPISGHTALQQALGLIPQGRNDALVIGDVELVHAHAALSPSSRHTRLSPDAGPESTLQKLEVLAKSEVFDVIVLDDRQAAFGAALGTLRTRAATAATLVWRLPASPAPNGHAGLDKPGALAALDASGWTLIDITDVPAVDPGIDAPSDWIVRAVSGPHPTPITVAALGMRKVAGVTDARIDHPLSAMASRPSVRAVWGAGAVEVPSHWSPGVLILHRQFLDGAGFVSAIEKRIEAGWLVVSEIDDDPRHWPQYAKADYRAFRGVHAVSVSTEPLARMIRRWNPHVRIFPNAASYLPSISPTTPKSGERIRVFFGALNREKDWAGIMRALEKVAKDMVDQVEFVVVHDHAFFEALPDVSKSFTKTLAYDDYLALLATCDIALLPLNDSPFNRLKSDLKFVECCAAGVVPICSPTVYGAEPRHREIAVFAETPKDWVRALRALAQNPAELARRRSLALDYVRSRRMHSDQAEVREGVFRALLADRDVLEADRKARLGG
jgi:glycosyltransferase involved in cell wall biosynthesis